MATSGTYAFSPELAQLVAEGAERCGIDPTSLSDKHMVSARRCFNFLFASWATKGFSQPWVTTYSVTLTQGQIQVPLVNPAIDVFHAYLTRSGYDVEMYPISRTEYEAIPNKVQQGRPTMYWPNYDTSNNNGSPTLYLWQASQNNTDIFNASVFNRPQDVTQSNQQFFIPYLWYDALAEEFAARFAQKWRPERADKLKMSAALLFKEARTSTREKASTRIRHRTRGGGWR